MLNLLRNSHDDAVARYDHRVHVTDIVDAWFAWFSGQKLDEMTILFGWPLLYWGRLGKCLAFLGGATILLDVIGPEKLGEWGNRWRYRLEQREWRTKFMLPVLALALFGILTVLTIVWRDDIEAQFPMVADYLITFALGATILLTLHSMRLAFIWLLYPMMAQKKPAQFIRWLGIALLAVGFHFDLLAS
ncbi:hypothetical protein [Allokutzneria oryzae]|uniref:Uncharacterized protein n=1 Tax=Allokutzneria oryzae TaxID=1378989 RepID=A0ABV6A0H2_9PSEU